METGGLSGRNRENLVLHVQRGKGKEGCHANKCRKLQMNNECLRNA